MAEEMKNLPPNQTVEIRHDNSIGEARRVARSMAASMGFASQAGEEIAIVMTELATNLYKYAGGGLLTLAPLAASGRFGLEIRSEDNGPGIADVEQAISDRFSTAGTHGTGLGAVNRMMDSLDITSRPGSGTHIVCRKWIREYKPSLEPCPLAVGVATRPLAPGQVNGDAFVVVNWSESILVGVIDGLGHGPHAYRAAQAARQYVETHFDQPFEEIFRGAGRVCHATRGVVMALARFDWYLGRMVFGSIGNIGVRIFPRSDRFPFITRRGVIGLNAPKPVVREHSWPAHYILVLHSDGVSSHWDLKDFGVDLPAAVIAQEILRAKARPEDDATVVVVRDVIA